MNTQTHQMTTFSPVSPVGTATFDPILFWNDVALEANRISHTNDLGEQAGPPLSARALAIVHLAMYDAYARVVNDPVQLPIYLSGVTLTAPATTAADLDAVAAAAVASAAHWTLSVLFPSQSATFNQRFAEAGDPGSPGHALGQSVAHAILLDRANDPGAATLDHATKTGRGRHRADPDNPGQKPHAPYYGSEARNFATTDPMRHGLIKPPFDNAEYKAALVEVRGRGIAPELMGTLPSTIAGRTPEETVRGIYWGYDGAAKLGTPPRLYNQIVRVIAMERHNTVAQNARLFALVNVALADAGILAWEQKYIHDFWRPVLGIREHDLSMGPEAIADGVALEAECDPNWLPLGAPSTNRVGTKNFTPPFPAYPSGHATFGAAALHMTRLFYGVTPGDRSSDALFKDQNGANLGFVSEEFDGVNVDNRGTARPRHVREFSGGLWQMIVENGLSRVDLGVHWVFDAFAVKTESGVTTPDVSRNIGGVPLGLAIAEDIFATGMMRSNVGPLPTVAAGGPAGALAAAIAGARDEGTARGGSWQDRVPYPPTE